MILVTVRFEMQEPIRQSLLNVLQTSLRAGGRRTYLHRVVYLGEFEERSMGELENLQQCFESNIKKINDDYCDESISGFGLFYPEYLIVVVEGSEETVSNHLNYLVDSLDNDTDRSLPRIDTIKVIMASHHIKQRIHTGWTVVKAKPDVTVTSQDGAEDTAENKDRIGIVFQKMLAVSNFLKEQWKLEQTGEKPKGHFRDTLSDVSNSCKQFLPEYSLLHSILQHGVLLDLRQFAGMYGSVPEYKLYQDLAWPQATDFVPYDIIGEDKSQQLLYLCEPGV